MLKTSANQIWLENGCFCVLQKYNLECDYLPPTGFLCTSLFQCPQSNQNVKEKTQNIQKIPKRKTLQNNIKTKNKIKHYHSILYSTGDFPTKSQFTVVIMGVAQGNMVCADHCGYNRKMAYLAKSLLLTTQCEVYCSTIGPESFTAYRFILALEQTQLSHSTSHEMESAHSNIKNV